MRGAALRTGLLVSLGVAMIIAVLVLVAINVLMEGQRGEAANELEDIVHKADDVEDPPPDMWLVIRDARGIRSTPGLPPRLPLRPALDAVRHPGDVEVDDLTVGAHQFRVRTERRRTDVVEAVLDLAPHQAEIWGVLRALLLIGGLGLVFGAIGGAWIGGVVTRPLAAALSAQRRFVSDASHELRTPITLLATRAQLLRRTLPVDRGSGHLRAAVDGLIHDTRQLSLILEDLLLAADQRTDQRQKVDLARLLDDVSQGSADHAHSRSVHLSVALPRTNTALEVIGAPVALRRAVTALLDNAIRHASTTVWLSCAEADGEVRIVVTDDGAGVDPEVQPRLFERFASARDAEEWPGAGVSRRHGIGLALVREIAAQHEGTVAWLDQPGRGATFQLTLPPATPSDGQQAGADGRTHR